MSDKPMRERLGLSLDEVGRIMHESWSATKRAQGFHGPNEPCHFVSSSVEHPNADIAEDGRRFTAEQVATCDTGIKPCAQFHPDLIPWEQLREKQKDINRHAFDALWPIIEKKAEQLLAAMVEELITHRYSPGDEMSGCSCGWYSDFEYDIDDSEYAAAIREWEKHIRNLHPDLNAVLERIGKLAISKFVDALQGKPCSISNWLEGERRKARLGGIEDTLATWEKYPRDLDDFMADEIAELEAGGEEER